MSQNWTFTPHPVTAVRFFRHHSDPDKPEDLSLARGASYKQQNFRNCIQASASSWCSEVLALAVTLLLNIFGMCYCYYTTDKIFAIPGQRPQTEKCAYSGLAIAAMLISQLATGQEI